jgi:hypothetical protein
MKTKTLGPSVVDSARINLVLLTGFRFAREREVHNFLFPEFQRAKSGT